MWWNHKNVKIKAEGKTELERFTNAMDRLLSVPHREVKAKLEAELIEKARRKAKTVTIHDDINGCKLPPF